MPDPSVKKNIFKKIQTLPWVKSFSSLKLAVLVIILICILAAIGTIIESKFNSEAATKLVYQSVWMWSVLFLLGVNLVMVMVDRWPWKFRHIPFLLAHIGILILLAGSWMTQKFGLDGSMRIGVNQSSRHVVSHQTDLTLFESKDGVSYNAVFKNEVDFFLEPPSAEKPLKIISDEAVIEIVDYKKYVVPNKKVNVSQDILSGSGLRYQFRNQRVNQMDWMVQSYPGEVVTQDLGPAQIHLAPNLVPARGLNEIVLIPHGEEVEYQVFHKGENKAFSQGRIKEGDSISLGWMDLELKILRYLPRAEAIWDVIEKDYPTPLTTGAIKVKYQGQERWVLLNDMLRLTKMGAVMRLIYAQRRIPLNFDIKLKKFEMDTYEGTQKASAYKSWVEVSGQGEHLISMNEPLKMAGLLFYQASFEDGPRGPTASIFSVNYDPGRWLKYLGALLMSLGFILLFYFKKFYNLPEERKVVPYKGTL